MLIHRTLDEIQTKLIAEIAQRQGIAASDIDPQERFANFNLLTSIDALNIVADLEQWVGVELPQTAMWDFPTIEALARFISEEMEREQKTS